MADWILPHLSGRPLTLVRCPGGSKKTCFFQKHAWAGLSDFIVRQTLRDSGKAEEVLFVRDIQGVVALAQAGVLEMHPWGATVERPDAPDRVIFDFDPGEGVAWADVITGAREVRDRLDRLNLTSFVKTTGGKGLHVVVPLTATASWDEAKSFTEALADAMVADSPERYTTSSAKGERGGRIFIDYLRNTRGATAVAPYSTRARPGAPVSTPLSWDELSGEMPSNHFTLATVVERVRGVEDPWADFHRTKQSLPKPQGRRKRSS